jgi:hypothetical protein
VACLARAILIKVDLSILKPHVAEHNMGLFSVSFHFRNTDEDALNAALARRGLNRYRLTTAISPSIGCSSTAR